jgi:uroporphyrin-3 C-methyltransferase
MSDQSANSEAVQPIGPAANAAPGEAALRPDDSPSGTGMAAPAPGQWSGLLAALAGVVALVALLATGFLWWQYREFYVSLSGADASTEAALQRVRAEQRSVDERLAALDEAQIAARNREDALTARLDALPSRFVDLERQLSALQGVSFDARQQWFRAEAQYYLTVANSELALTGRWDTAVTALELADGRLRELGNPAFNPVRERIAAELLALRSVRLPDVSGLSYSLGRLAARVSELPFSGELPGRYAGEGAAPTVEPGLARLWASIKAALGSLISVQRRDVPVERALSAADRTLIRRQLGVELELARLALVAGEPESFRQSLTQALGLLRAEFDGSAAPVESAVALLDGMLGIEIAPVRPDISGSLNLLRGLPAGTG